MPVDDAIALVASRQIFNRVLMLQRLHQSKLKEYESLISSRKRKLATDDDERQSLAKVQTTLDRRSLSSFSGTGISQSALDKLIVKYIVDDLQPFNTTEKPAFQNLIRGIVPNRTLISRKTIMQRIEEDAVIMKRDIMSLLQKQRLVATTTDCWSSRHRSYLGVTCHWINESTLQRHSSALACRRLKGSHTFDVLAAALEGIHVEYKIQDKIVKTTTDNGSNFCKAFEQFAAVDGDDGDEQIQPAENADVAEYDGMQFSVVDDILSERDGDYHLPPHQRCACHTLNLVATKDAATAESDQTYKKLNRSTFAKCQALFNKQSRSVMASEIIEQAFGLHLVIPNQTRWNSTYMALERLNRLITDKGVDVLNHVCSKLDLPEFRRPEVAFVTEFVTVMKPLAQALDILQCETNAYMAYYVPTLVILTNKMQYLQQSSTVQSCQPLVSAILHGVRDRFAADMSKAEYIAAAIVHPKFKTAWIKDGDQRRAGIQYLTDKVQQNLLAIDTAINHEAAEDTTSEAEDDFFTFNAEDTATADSIVSSYLSGVAAGVGDLAVAHPQIRKIFIELNTALPASAACERLFSVAGRIFVPNRCRLSDKHFEQQLLLRINRKFVQ